MDHAVDGRADQPAPMRGVLAVAAEHAEITCWLRSTMRSSAVPSASRSSARPSARARSASRATPLGAVLQYWPSAPGAAAPPRGPSKPRAKRSSTTERPSRRARMRTAGRCPCAPRERPLRAVGGHQDRRNHAFSAPSLRQPASQRGSPDRAQRARQEAQLAAGVRIPERLRLPAEAIDQDRLHAAVAAQAKLTVHAADAALLGATER